MSTDSTDSQKLVDAVTSLRQSELMLRRVIAGVIPCAEIDAYAYDIMMQLCESGKNIQFFIKGLGERVAKENESSTPLQVVRSSARSDYEST